jgi:DNA repair exonuclease SbcCD ATPase subunit
MPDRTHADLDFDEEDEPTSVELQSQVQKAQAELAELKRRSDQIERDKLRLEELSRRQDELETGRAEMIDKFTRAMVVIQRETQDAEKRLDQLHNIHEAFTSHQQALEGINPKAWIGLDLSKELSKALSAVEEARTEYSRSRPKLSAEPAAAEARGESGLPAEYEEYYVGGDKGFFYWLKAGLAFTLPLTVLSVLGLLIWIWSLTAK